MMETIHWRLKMEFLYYNCFSAITYLIVGLHTLHASKSRANVVVVSLHKKWSFPLKISPVNKTKWSKECVLKYDKNSHAKIGTIWMYLGNTFSRIYYGTMRLRRRKFKEVLKNQAV